MPTTQTLVRDTRRRLRAATVGAAGKAARALDTATHSTPATIASLARDMVAPSSHPLSDPPPASGLRPVLGQAEEPLLGAIRPMTTERVDWGMERQREYGNLWWTMIAGRRFVYVTGGDATKQVLINRDKEFSQDGWVELIGHFFGGGLMLRSFGEHLDHRRIMQSAFTQSRLAGYLAGMDAAHPAGRGRLGGRHAPDVHEAQGPRPACRDRRVPRDGAGRRTAASRSSPPSTPRHGRPWPPCAWTCP